MEPKALYQPGDCLQNTRGEIITILVADKAGYIVTRAAGKHGTGRPYEVGASFHCDLDYLHLFVSQNGQRSAQAGGSETETGVLTPTPTHNGKNAQNAVQSFSVGDKVRLTPNNIEGIVTKIENEHVIWVTVPADDSRAMWHTNFVEKMDSPIVENGKNGTAKSIVVGVAKSLTLPNGRELEFTRTDETHVRCISTDETLWRVKNRKVWGRKPVSSLPPRATAVGVNENGEPIIQMSLF